MATGQFVIDFRSQANITKSYLLFITEDCRLLFALMTMIVTAAIIAAATNSPIIRGVVKEVADWFQ